MHLGSTLFERLVDMARSYRSGPRRGPGASGPSNSALSRRSAQIATLRWCSSEPALRMAALYRTGDSSLVACLPVAQLFPDTLFTRSLVVGAFRRFPGPCFGCAGRHRGNSGFRRNVPVLPDTCCFSIARRWRAPEGKNPQVPGQTLDIKEQIAPTRTAFGTKLVEVYPQASSGRRAVEQLNVLGQHHMFWGYPEFPLFFEILLVGALATTDKTPRSPGNAPQQDDG